MLVRIVRLTIAPKDIETFLDKFDETAPHIRAFSGCLHLELWRDMEDPNVCTTCSHWISLEALEAYRTSDLFQKTWDSVKPLFIAQPKAHSYTVSRPAATIEQAANNL